MKRYILLLAAFVMLPLTILAQTPSYTYSVEAGTTLFTRVPATATATSAAVRLPIQSTYGVLTVTESGITGSPSGCQFAEAFQANNSTTTSTSQATVAFTPATGVQFLNLTPTVLAADNIVLTYSCSTYPTAGTISVTFAPIDTVLTAQSITGDPCLNPSVAKTSAVIGVTSATTTQLVALSAGKSVYVCNVATLVAGTTPSIALSYGTGSACGTGTTSLTGVMAVTSGAFLTLGWGGTISTAPAGNAVCLVTAGTGSPNFQGVITYVQQ